MGLFNWPQPRAAKTFKALTRDMAADVPPAFRTSTDWSDDDQPQLDIVGSGCNICNCPEQSCASTTTDKRASQVLGSRQAIEHSVCLPLYPQFQQAESLHPVFSAGTHLTSSTQHANWLITTTTQPPVESRHYPPYRPSHHVRTHYFTVSHKLGSKTAASAAAQR